MTQEYAMIRVDRDFHTWLKVAAAMRQMTIKAFVEDACRAKMQQERTLKEQAALYEITPASERS